MKDHIKNLYEAMQDDLQAYDATTISPAKRLTGRTGVVLKAIESVKLYLDGSPFKNAQEEIQFFKNEKPLFVCEQMAAQHIFNVQTQQIQRADEKSLTDFYESELAVVNHYFNQNQLLYKYFQLEANELDYLLFVRGVVTTTVILPETPDLDPRYSTKGDYLFAKFHAYERLKEHLLSLRYPSTEREKLKKSLNWTGDKLNLIEIAYGIYDTAQINNGDIDIKDIVLWLEDSLNISLTRHYRLFNELKGRKLVSKTKFLDHASAMIQEHLNKGDEFRPRVPRSATSSKSAPRK